MGGWDKYAAPVRETAKNLEEDPVGTVGKVAVGTTVGSVVGGSPGGVAGAVEGAAPGTVPGLNTDDISSKLGFSTDKERELRSDARNTLTQGYAASQSTLGQMKDAEGNYVTNMDPAIEKAAKGEHKANDIFIGGIKELSQQAIDQGKQADKVYSNDILPQYKNIMERAQTEAGGAMKLQEVGDPNNAVAAATRGLYDAKGAGIASQFRDQAGQTQGAYNTTADQTQSAYDNVAGQTQNAYNAQGAKSRSAYNDEAENARGMYDDTIQGMGRQGLADSGILAALGAQATAGQLGGGNLMTGGQMAALQGQNMSQAGMAYARAQGQMQKLREQGLGRAQDLRETGLGAETNFAGQGLDSATGLRSQGLGSATTLRGQGLDAATNLNAEGLGRQADLGARGLEQGFAQSAAQYDRGQQALDRWRGSTGDFEGANNRLWDVQSDIRDERTNYKNLAHDARIGDARSQLGYTTQRESNKLGASMNDLNRVMANDQGYYGGMANASLGQANAQAAGQAGKIGAITNLAGAGMQAYAGMPRAPQQAATAPPEEEYPGYGGYDSNYGQYSGYA